MVTECCGSPPIDGTEGVIPPGVWVGRCRRCKEMAVLVKKEEWEGEEQA